MAGRLPLPQRPIGAALIAGAALLCIPLNSSPGQQPQENYFDRFDVAWEDSCSAADDDSWCKFTIRVTGEIIPGTVVRLEKALARSHGRERLLVTLNSLGGDLGSAMKMGRLIRSSRARTVVEESATCASACVLVFAAGLSRIVDVPRTWLPVPWLNASGFPSAPPFDPSKPFEVLTTHPSAIGIHRPALAGATRQADMPKVKAAADQYERELREYAAEINVSSRLIDDMLTIPPEQIRWLSENDLKSYGLGFLDPVYAETISITQSKKYNISPSQYRNRNANPLFACKNLLADDDHYGFLESPHRSGCVIDIISGKIPALPPGAVMGNP
jgi:hypothetical protein